MYRLFIADDENIMRESLAAYIPWGELGFTVAGVFEDGETLLDALNSESPDVVLTDIRMGAVSGIDIAREICERWPEVKTILISGFQDFEYARAAIRYGVFSYIPKPASVKEIRSEFSSLKNVLDEERRRIKELDHMRSGRESLRSGLRRLLLSEIVAHRIRDDHGLRSFLERQGEDIDLARHPIADFLFSPEAENGMPDQFLSACFDVDSIQGETLEDYFEATVFMSGAEDACVRLILLSRLEGSPDWFSGVIEKKITMLLEHLSARVGIPLSIRDTSFFSDAHSFMAEKKTMSFSETFQYIPADDQDVVGRIVRMIRERFASDLSLTTVADAIGLNPIYVSRLFKEKTGVNFIDYVTSYRISMAERLLKDPEIKVYEAGERAGYKNVKYFYKLFKKATGLTPTEFRRREGIRDGLS